VPLYSNYWGYPRGWSQGKSRFLAGWGGLPLIGTPEQIVDLRRAAQAVPTRDGTLDRLGGGRATASWARARIGTGVGRSLRPGFAVAAAC
jgi:hypothetical protein